MDTMDKSLFVRVRIKCESSWNLNGPRVLEGQRQEEESVSSLGLHSTVLPASFGHVLVIGIINGSTQIIGNNCIYCRNALIAKGWE